MAKETNKKAVTKEVAEKKPVVTKTELIEMTAAKTEQSKTATAETVNAFLDSIMEVVADGKQAQLKGFATFDYRVRAAGKGRNPQTGDEIEIEEQPITTASVGREFKRVVKEAYVPSTAKKSAGKGKKK